MPNRWSTASLCPSLQVETFAGAREEVPSAGFVDFLSLPTTARDAGQAIQLLLAARDVAKACVRRCREAAVGQRVALEMELLSFISSLALDTLPSPSPPGSGFWDTELATAALSAAEAQRTGLRVLLELTALYGFAWQGIECPERAAESERLLTVCQLLRASYKVER